MVNSLHEHEVEGLYITLVTMDIAAMILFVKYISFPLLLKKILLAYHRPFIGLGFILLLWRLFLYDYCANYKNPNHPIH
jgi:hypothetical protein